MFSHLLVPVDGSELSQHAVHAAIELASRLGGSLTGFICEPAPALPIVGMHPSHYERATVEQRQQAEAHALSVLAAFEQAAQQAGVAYAGCYRQSDDVVQAIIEVAQERGCDLIVMATHGRGLFGDLVFGSHAKAVISRCKLPVLVLH
ncbi:universal stress protein [Paucibacter sp. APW11]|uniref:Universal stress protein n=1 Tax=Roseateles aquae TaxID=3077235 RepID=A0ABU3P6G6_9BURK|nr:universal stress protein [Paucibacter sp. APW11]MDT8998163.1 universal stress protein [Paucibacter sp. APW11]